MPKAVNRSHASRSRRRLRGAMLAAVALLGGAASSAAPAFAAPSAAPLSPSTSSASAEAGHQSWAKAYAQGQWSAAIELLETIPEPSRTAWHWLHLARAFERRSQLVEAFAAYERVHDLAADEAAGAGVRELERQAMGESAALAARIPWAEVTFGMALPLGSLIFIDQQWLEPARLRSPYPVNPGWHTFLVESNGEVLAARRAFFEEGQTRLVPLLSLDDIGAAATSPLSSAHPGVDRFGIEYDALTGGASSVDHSITAPAAHAPRASSLTWRPVGERRADADQGSTSGEADGLLRASYVSLGAGALGTLVGTGFLISTLHTRSAIADLASCYTTRCEQTARADAERKNRTWRARASAATFSYAVGLAGLVTGGVLWLLHRESSARPATIDIADLSLEVAPRFSPHGATLKGTF